MDKTREFIGSTIFRKKKFKYKFDELMELLSGTGTSYRHLVLDQGKFSKKKTDALINELMKCLVEVRAYWNISENWTGGEMIYNELTAKEKSFYKSLFYLLLGLGMYSGDVRWSSSGRYEGGTWNNMDFPPSFSTYKTAAELDRDLIYVSRIMAFTEGAEFRCPEGIFYRLVPAYEYVTGGLITDILTKSEYQRGYELLNDLEKRFHDDHEYLEEYLKKENEPPHDIDLYVDESDCSPDYAYSENEIDEMNEKEEMLFGSPDNDDRIEEWKIFFADETRFISSCKTVRKGMFDSSIHGNLDKELSAVIECFLSKSGTSIWMDDETFFPIYTYLNKIYLASEKAIRRKG